MASPFIFASLKICSESIYAIIHSCKRGSYVLCKQDVNSEQKWVFFHTSQNVQPQCPFYNNDSPVMIFP